VVQEHETISVSLEQERITVERVPVTEQVDPNAARDAFPERDIEVPVVGEEAVVGKQTRATKAVRVRKERVTVEADPDAVQADDTGTPRTRNRKPNRKRRH
jgi:stress response protein YsnF